MSNNIHLTLKKKWFDMIASGEKPEEYREIKPYWIVRLTNINYPEEEEGGRKGTIENMVYDIVVNQFSGEDVLKAYFSGLKSFDTITFRNGYQKNAPELLVECKGIEIREGNPKWGALPGEIYFVIKLGKILNQGGNHA